MKQVRIALTTSAIFLVGLAAAQPLLTAGGRLPWAADTLIHLYRLVELDHLLRQGYLFPRYAPDLAYGFGFPLFNFYAPLSYYIAELFRQIGTDFSPALLATFVVLILWAGLGMYAWTAEVWGQRAGIVAAAAYVTAPYLLYNVYHRGALAEMLAVALMPTLLWAITRLARQTNSRPYTAFILTALLYAALLLGHNITALVFTPIIVLYAVLVTYQAARSTLQALLCALPILLGLGLAAFFWAPAFLERNSVQTIQLFLPQVFDYHYNFVTLGELFSLPVTVDPNLVLPPTPRSIGLIPLTLAVLALAFGWQRWSGRQKSVAGFAAALTLVSSFLTLPQSVAVWDALPILRFVQFPWRFLSFASLGLAFLAGSAFADFSPQRHEDTKGFESLILGVLVSWWLIGLLVAGMIVYGFTWQYVPYLQAVIRPTVADIARYERESGALGTTSAGDYLPNTVKKLPGADALAERYSRSDVIERLDPAALPPGAKVIEAYYRPLASDVTIDSTAPFTATFDTFYFAGWQARVDGQPASITPTDPHGLISFPVPTGRHRIQVSFGTTPLRTAASVISLLSALVLIGLAVFRPVFSRLPDLRSGDLLPATCDLRLATWVCVLTVSLFAFKSLYLDAHETIFRRTRFDGTRVAGIAHPLNVNFDNEMALMGYEPETLATDASAVGSVRVTLYWRALRKLDVDLSVSAQLVDERGFVYGQRDSQHPGGYPTSRWTSSDYARDIHEIPLAPGTPPGQYRLRVGVYRVGAPSGLSILDANGAPSGTTFELAKVTVGRPGPLAWLQSKPALPRPEHTSGVTLAPGLVLMGYDLPQTQVDVGARLYFTLYWQATEAQTRDLKARLQLIDPGGAAVFSTQAAPISPQFATNRLQSGDVLRGPNAIRIPASTPGGTFALRLSLADHSDRAMGDAVELGQVTIRVPQRVMTAPRVQHQAQADFANQARLVGYDFESQISNLKSQIDVVLYWQAAQEMTSDYKSFVHLLDSTGRFVAGSDMIPANWTRPTTGWIAGEYVIDPHTLALQGGLAPGEYQIEVGMYDAESNLRLGESILLDQKLAVTP